MPLYRLRRSKNQGNKDCTEEMLGPTSWELRKQSRELERPGFAFARRKAAAHKARCAQKYRDFSPFPISQRGA